MSRTKRGLLNGGVTLDVRGGEAGWIAVATHNDAPGERCVVFGGDARPIAPATEPDVIACTE